jgi:hypothetical protein
MEFVLFCCYRFSGLCPSSEILNTGKHNVSETGSDPVFKVVRKTPTMSGPLERAKLNKSGVVKALT